MPPRQPNLTSETGREAAVLGLLAMDNSVAAARPNASSAALDPALSEKDAAGPATASARSLSSLLKRYWHALQQRRQRENLRAALHELSDRELQDIGVTREEIDYLARHRTIDGLADSTAYLWVLSRGVM